MTRTSLVIDASAALHLALSTRMTKGLDGYELIAPPLFLSERTSALAAAAYRGSLPSEVLDDAFDRVESMIVAIVDGGRDHRYAALSLAQSLGWAKTYDAEYVALAIRRGCALLTTDARLGRGARHLVEVLDPRSLEPT